MGMPPTYADVALHHVDGLVRAIARCLAFHAGFFDFISRHALHGVASAFDDVFPLAFVIV